MVVNNDPSYCIIFQLIDRTCMTPTPTLEQHLMWDDIAILLRYLLMLSFNNSLDGKYSYAINDRNRTRAIMFRLVSGSNYI